MTSLQVRFYAFDVGNAIFLQTFRVDTSSLATSRFRFRVRKKISESGI